MISKHYQAAQESEASILMKVTWALGNTLLQFKEYFMYKHILYSYFLNIQSGLDWLCRLHREVNVKELMARKVHS